jgi:hypothetical protein
LGGAGEVFSGAAASGPVARQIANAARTNFNRALLS